MNKCFYKITNDIVLDLSSFLERLNYSKLVFLVDENTYNFCFPVFFKGFKKEHIVIDIKAGEHFKILSTVESIWSTLLNNNIDKDAILINLGGGTVSDVGGFVATTYKRGIRFINIPTTLMSQIDASIGGKTGINYNGIKNVIGTIEEPIAIFVYPDFILTQQFRELKSGFAEMIKHALLKGGELWEKTKTITFFDVNKINKLIGDNIEVKYDFVSKDLFDKNIRHALNFGHTIGHGIESCSLEKKETPFLHGEAVAIGMVIESLISHRKKMLPKKTLKIIRDFIEMHFKLPAIENVDSIIKLLKNDKKNKKGKINFILLEEIGQYIIDVSVTVGEIYDAIAEYNLSYKSS